MPLELGSIVEGTVTGITDYGAFVKLPDGSTGLVHISEVADEYVTDVHNFVQEKQTIRVKVLSQNNRGKYDLSIKQVDATSPEPPPVRKPKRRPDNPRQRGGPGTGDFEDMLNRWKKESDERLLDVKRHTEQKRGGRGSKGGRGR